MIDVLNDNEAFSVKIEEVAGHIEKIISEAGITTREKIRDYLRAESVVDEFSSRFFQKIV